MAPTTLENLPPDIQLCILASLPDVQSLASAALLGPTWYETFKEKEDYIIKKVLINCVGLDTLPEAILTNKCQPTDMSCRVEHGIRLDDSSFHALESYLCDFLQELERPMVTAYKFTMESALEICDFHVRVITPLTQKFIYACGRAPRPRVTLADSLASRPISRMEEERISRTLYRFEIFRKLFGRFSDRERELLRYIIFFFSKFAPWENAQLGCIHDFLAHELIPAFTDVAKHDVAWGEHSVDYRAGFDHPSIQHLLTLGLEKILEISLSDSYADREVLLKVDDMPPCENDKFLSWALSLALETSPHHGPGQFILEAGPFCPEDDGGAEMIWKLSKRQFPRKIFTIYDDSDWPYRQWGYILWDRERLQTLGVLEPPWIPAQTLPHVEFPSFASLQASWEARAAIYRRGGRGYWENGDETRIVWSRRSNKEIDQPSFRFVPASLEEAKKFWQNGLQTI